MTTKAIRETYNDLRIIMDTNEAIKKAFEASHEDSSNDIKDLPDFILDADKFTLMKVIRELAVELSSRQ